MMFLCIFLNSSFELFSQKVQIPFRYAAAQCTVSGSSLSMLSIPDCRSRQARLLQGRPSFGGNNNAEITRGEGAHSSFHLSPGMPGIPCWLKLPKMKATLIPSCHSVPYTASIFSQESFVNYESKSQFWGLLDSINQSKLLLCIFFLYGEWHYFKIRSGQT